MTIYVPREDSYFLSEVLKEHLKHRDKIIKILDMGSGSGIQAELCKKLGFENITAADIDEEAVSFLKRRGFNAVKSNLFSNIQSKFSLIVFNPPYLPEHKYDKEKDTTGGKRGYETIIEFLKQAKSHLEKQGKILLLFSSLSNPKVIKEEAEKLGYKISFLASKKLFLEELFVYMLE